MVHDMPQGQPGPRDRGLDHTHNWGRTYWGGAIFCLLADVQFRERTGNRRGLQHALRGILAAGGNVDTEWTMERTLTAGDDAVGVPVLKELYE
jgi:predicted metalloprotease with PDZ domain